MTHHGAVTRIISGEAGGRRLRTPSGDGTRPTTDRVREALFSSLEARDVIDGAHVMDLYAGSWASHWWARSISRTAVSESSVTS